ncbi:10273_t:CDS:2 [Racocetra fulgida]|uniref:ATP-dependent RNA helicase n=1 Tax=Racocetra fulgida TaxID=60492 RepID=A0A9N9B4S0_9GLOM|nr:10273_t:CDS:2 [Racocetra fulgida]
MPRYRKKLNHGNQRKFKRDQIQKELEELEENCKALTIDSKFETFNELPLSTLTLKGLQEANYVEMTEIQCKALPLALRGEDILGAAKTGSGKTLAFLIPVKRIMGLDFPAVDWVIQLDAPGNADTYIHRVGRTARYEASGLALLFLLPSEEEGMKKALEQKKVPIGKTKVKRSKTMSIQNQLQSFCFQDPEIKYLAQKAFISYMRSVYLQSDKSIFKIDELPAEEFSASLGLPGAPKIKFVKPKEVTDDENSEDNQSSDSDDASDEEKKKNSKPKTRIERIFNRKNMSVFTDHYQKLVDQECDNLTHEYDEFITLKRVNHELSTELEQMFQDEKAILDNALTQKQTFIEKELKVMREKDEVDKMTVREKKRRKLK